MQHAALESFLESCGDTLLDWRFKGFGSLPMAPTLSDVQRNGLNLHDLGSPMMSIDLAIVAENVLSMAAWCQSRGLLLCPHGKTTMAPTLWLGQLMSGSIGITVANDSQLRAARAFGIDRIQLANELVSEQDIAWVAAELDADPAFDFLCWVDSVEGAARIQSTLALHRKGRPIPVCVEVGVMNGRTGARGLDSVLAVAQAVVSSERLLLAGISCYEGAVPGAGTDAAGIEAIDDFLRSVVAAHQAVVGLYETPRGTVTAGGSAYFDRVAAILGPLGTGSDGKPVDVVLRSGSYVVHDDGHYREVTPSTRGDGPRLRSAIHVWSRVVSRPQQDLAIIDAGRRDVPFDLGLPLVLSASRSGNPRTEVTVRGSTLLQLNDQHGFVRVSPDSPLSVGDVVKLGLSHPCTAFDKWRAIPIIDSADLVEPRVGDVALTFF
jgi:D-serine deaminase-like pyridoxal phosphate-dependent protein